MGSVERSLERLLWETMDQLGKIFIDLWKALKSKHIKKNKKQGYRFDTTAAGYLLKKNSITVILLWASWNFSTLHCKGTPDNCPWG